MRKNWVKTNSPAHKSILLLGPRKSFDYQKLPYSFRRKQEFCCNNCQKWLYFRDSFLSRITLQKKRNCLDHLVRKETCCKQNFSLSGTLSRIEERQLSDHFQPRNRLEGLRPICTCPQKRLPRFCPYYNHGFVQWIGYQKWFQLGPRIFLG